MMGSQFSLLIFSAPLCLQTFACQQDPQAQSGQKDLSDTKKTPTLERIRQIESTSYRVYKVQQNENIIRVNIELKALPTTERTLQEQTLEALHDLQADIGTETRLAIWAYHGEPLTIQGMAFYSSVTESYHFKLAEELE